jgi:membrane protease YdiL (CAAX protease family)
MSIALFIIFILYTAISAVLGYRKIAGLKESVISEGERIKFYKECVIESWLIAVILLILLACTKVPFQNIGLKAIDTGYMNYPVWTRIVTFVICGLFLALFLYQMAGYLLSKKYRVQLNEKLAGMRDNGKPYNVMLDVMLPKRRREKRWFAVVSLTAGIAEEIIYRGFLTYLLLDLFPEAPFYVLLAVAGLFFGIAHCYQGFSGMIKTGLMGVMFTSLYFASGSLLPGILLHFISDFSSNFLLSEEPLKQENRC